MCLISLYCRSSAFKPIFDLFKYHLQHNAYYPVKLKGKINKKRKKRLFFEYSDKVYMQLNYDKSKEMIVFDHLSPSQEKFKGNYQYYGPDFSIDGLFFKKGKWILKEDLDIRRKKNNKPKWKYDPSENFY